MREKSRLFVVAVVMSAVSGAIARADYLVGGNSSVYLVNDAGQVVRQYGESLAEFPGALTESVDAYALSRDGATVYVFGNDLGGITNFGFDFATGQFLGVLGTPTPHSTSTPNQPWPNGMIANFGISQPTVRRDVPSGGSDLLYIGRINPFDGPPLGDTQLLNVVDSVTFETLHQVLPAQPAQIYDFALGPGALGSQSRVYLATSLGVFAYDEVLTQTGTSFELASNTPLIVEEFRQLEYGSDGNLYGIVRESPSTGSGVGPIERYSSVDGSFIDTFLTASEVNPSGDFDGMSMSMGPDGRLHVMRGQFDVSLEIASFDLVSGDLRGITFMNSLASDAFGTFTVLPVPEPATATVVLAFAAILPCGWRRR